VIQDVVIVKQMVKENEKFSAALQLPTTVISHEKVN
jgi:hypothetical protein